MTENAPNSACESARAIRMPVTKFVPLIRTWSASAHEFLRRNPRRGLARTGSAGEFSAAGVTGASSMVPTAVDITGSDAKCTPPRDYSTGSSTGCSA